MIESPFKTFVAGQMLAAHRRVKLSGATVVYSDAGELSIGVTETDALITEDITVRLENAGGTVEMTAAGTITAGSAFYAAADGLISAVVVGPPRGYALEGSTALNDIIECLWTWADETWKDTAQAIYNEDFFTGAVNAANAGHKFSQTADLADWLKSSTDGGTDQADICGVVDDGPGGILQFTCNDANGDNENVQLNGEAFQFQVGKRLYFEAGVALKDVDKCDFFIGLAIADVDILGGVTDRVGFENLHTGDILAMVEQDNTESSSDTGVNAADCAAIANFAATKLKLAFEWDGVDTVYFYVNDVLVVTKKDNGAAIVIPDDEALSPAFQVKTHTGAAAVQTVFVDYIKICAER